MHNHLIKTIKKNFLDLIFPKICAVCNIMMPYRIEKNICQLCLNSISFVNKNCCLFCKAGSENGNTCSQCRKDKYLDQVLCMGYYKDPNLQKIIKAMKYNLIVDLIKGK